MRRIVIHFEELNSSHNAVAGMKPEQIEEYVRIGMAVNSCASIRFTEPALICNAAGKIIGSLAAEAVAVSSSGQVYEGESISDVLLHIYEAEHICEAGS
ncbi:hypothetical protein [Chromobacterium amazonense]|uniref:Uncharacterized protein n=1 Tax=Chromobacterium amazonense TaxID=1382803 RepID=A0ABU8V2F6_9NEIS|nr:hypothetical protein [Chromobacterium amazonense]KIA79955.1 hypothetical protein QR66_13135 [Chromobacterium piscinae]MDQ4538866.1 hypothetical protein [Chromobacterium amazonense]